ncbi:C2orf83 isoform 3 [Pongo abelii]|uniref:C2orf83 isoform 3 n=1 Tax=Pongo abelii TaxID=9601 RepID=A0A2J8SHS8_PONAB|nr:C2orf83 isoform 3 [Pongo abelii]
MAAFTVATSKSSGIFWHALAFGINPFIALMSQPIVTMTVVDNQGLGLPVDIQHKAKPLTKASQMLPPDLGTPSFQNLLSPSEKLEPWDPGMRKLTVQTCRLTFALRAMASATQLHKLQPETLSGAALNRPSVREGACNERSAENKKPQDSVL